MYLIILAVFFVNSKAMALDLRLMTFNTMCDFCHKDERDSFQKRKALVRKVIEDHKADLIALQEVRTGSQVKSFFQNLSNYELFFTKSVLMSYADPALAVNTEKFEVLEDGQFWLGPGDGFNLGWKLALPRQTVWVKLKSKKSRQVFYFVSSHFDNRVENLIGAADMMSRFLANLDAPVIFAGDTNLVPAFEGYELLVQNGLVNAFEIKDKFTAIGAVKSDADLCYHRKGDDFPACRVDHILLSSQHEWKVKEWKIDARKMGPEKRYPSDHRAVISEISLN